jgi:hypothetical protein
MGHMYQETKMSPQGRDQLDLSEKVIRTSVECVTAVGLPHQVATCQVRSSWAGRRVYFPVSADPGPRHSIRAGL